MDFVRPPYKTVADAIREEAIEETTASVTYSAIVKALEGKKLSVQDIASYNSVSLERVLEIQSELQTKQATT